MRQLMLSAMHSGAGKTVFTCALLAAMKKRGEPVTAFKCGPDYLDPLFHRRVLGLPGRNLDLILQGEAGVEETLRRAGEGFAILEGAMGYYDGLGGTTEGSAWDLARRTDCPVLLLLRPRGASLSLAAQVRGMLHFRSPSRIAGLALCDCTEGLFAYLKPLLEAETGLPVLGFLPPMEQARWDSRHLGLLRPEEVDDLAGRVDALAEALERHVDLAALLALAGERSLEPVTAPPAPARCRIAVARDEAFCFLYEDNLDRLRARGAELSFFSPLRDAALPEAEGLYLCGGYPEVHAEALSANASMRESVRQAVTSGLPTVAESGGFLYLQQSLEDEAGRSFPMCGALEGQGFATGRLQRFGYQSLCAPKDSLLLRQGEEVPAHEFHYWDSTCPGADLRSRKADGRSWPCGHATASLYAAFPQLHFGGALPLADRFVNACVTRRENGTA